MLKILNVSANSEAESGVFYLDATDNFCFMSTDEVRKKLVANPAYFVPYNILNASKVLSKRPENASLTVARKIAGAPDLDKQFKAIEQTVGTVQANLLKTNLPCVVIASMFKNQNTSEDMCRGKIIVDCRGKQLMYAFLRYLAVLQESEAQSNKCYLGLANGKVFNDRFEVLTSFILSFDALKRLQKENFGFLVDVSAISKYDYKLANESNIAVSKAKLNDLTSWANAHNDMILASIKKKVMA